MSYTLNGIDLSIYGFIPGRAEGSNLAVSGCWDMPGRIGKVWHSWGYENGVEPYVLADEIRFGGRDITLHGVIQGDDEADALNKAYSLYDVINAFTGLVTLACEWGSWSVYINGQIEATYHHSGVATVKIPFREPVVDLTGGTPVGDDFELGDTRSKVNLYEVTGIDGVLFADLGLSPLKREKFLSRPTPKAGERTAYSTEGYKITRAETEQLVLRAYIEEANYVAFNNRIKSLFYLFKKAGIRYLTEGNDSIVEFFAANGFRVTNVTVESGRAVGFIEIDMRYYNEVTFDDALIDLDGIELMDSDSEVLIDS